MASRTQVAQVVAQRLGHDRSKVLREAAAWLVSTGRARQARYLARDVAEVLAQDRGYVLVNVVTARKLDERGKRELTHFIKQRTGAKEVELAVTVDASVIGGVRIETPSATLDATVRTKLSNYVEKVTA